MDLAPSLPDDALADILRRLAPRDLAASRCVRKSWRRVVDGRRLLRADLLPLSLGGIFLNLHDHYFTQFLNRPTAGAAVSGRLDYTCHACEPGRYPPPRAYVDDHCNGLLLFDHCVVNPATRQWALLPPPPEEMPQPPPPGMHFTTDKYLLFDPTLSPNYFELLILPDVPFKLNKNGECEEIEWPPSTLILPVFSSKTGSWEDRSFSREGEAAGRLPGMVGSVRLCHGRQSAYWQGALYICCSDCYFLRISLSDNKYRVIRLPADVSEEDQEFYLGKSVKGIYCASLCKKTQLHGIVKKLKVWFLSSPTEWLLKHDRDILPILPNLNFDKNCNRPWILQEFDYWYKYDADQVSDEEDAMAESNEALVEEVKFHWDSDNDDVLEPGSVNNGNHIDILGFHPYKEVVLLSLRDRVLAYHLTTSKIQHLGKLFPKFYSLRMKLDVGTTVQTKFCENPPAVLFLLQISPSDLNWISLSSWPSPPVAGRPWPFLAVSGRPWPSSAVLRRTLDAREADKGHPPPLPGHARDGPPPGRGRPPPSSAVLCRSLEAREASASWTRARRGLLYLCSPEVLCAISP